jgi:cytochrome c
MPELLITVFLIAGAVGAPPPRYGIGRTAPAELIRRWDITVSPDGRGLPPGQGTARAGQGLYERSCAACHGLQGEGQGDYPPLAEGRGTLATAKPVQTVGSFWPYATTVWDYVHRAMPYQAPGSLKPDEVYALTAYILYLNKIVKRDEILSRQTLPSVKMPNRDGFVPDPRPDVKSARGGEAVAGRPRRATPKG